MKVFHVLIFILFGYISYGQQPNVYIFQDVELDTLYDIRKDVSLQPYFQKKFFPGYHTNQATVDGLNMKLISESSEYVVYNKEFAQFKPDTTQLFIKIFTENIDSIEIQICNSETCYLTTITVLRDGYQRPYIKALADFETIPRGRSRDKTIVVRTFNENVNERSRFFVGDLVIRNFIEVRIPSQLPFFKALFKNQPDKNQTKNLLRYDYIQHQPRDFFVEYLEGINFLDANMEEETHYFKKIVRSAIINYPFYHERGLNAEVTLNKFDSLVKRFVDYPFCNFAYEIKNFLKREFRDGHFRVDLLKCNKYQKKVAGPLRVFPIGKKFLIAAIFDTTLAKKVPIGSELIAINNEPFLGLLENALKENYGLSYDGNSFSTTESNFNLLREVANEILRREVDREMFINYITPKGKTYRTSVTYSSKYNIPERFIARHCNFKMLTSQIAYLRVSKFDSRAPFCLANVMDSLSNKRIDLIIDLRANGGGEMSAVIQMLNTLLYQPVYKHYYYQSRLDNQIDSLIIKNRNFGKFNKTATVALLVDENTACASEVFIENLKIYRNETVIVGRAATKGALTPVYDINFPSKKVRLYLNAPSVGKFLLTEGSIEHVGIEPDILVGIDNIYDLKPYSDKVLKTAMEYLNNAQKQVSRGN